MCGLEVLSFGEVNEEVWVLAIIISIKKHYKKSNKLKQHQLDVLNRFLH
jgi:hypothetical protein|tara:strand:- start:353 stop:499 length:147 start_codon:yes stop_codon:yes gene_type:complete